MVHVPIAEDGRVDADRPLVERGVGRVLLIGRGVGRGVGRRVVRRVVRRVHEQRLEVGARGELRDLEELVAEDRAARRVRCAAQCICEPRRVRTELEDDGLVRVRVGGRVVTLGRELGLG